MTLLEYLAQSMPFEFDDGASIPGVLIPTRRQAIAALVFINGGPEVRGWGVMESGGPYGRRGLSGPQEGLALMNMTSFVSGWLKGPTISRWRRTRPRCGRSAVE